MPADAATLVIDVGGTHTRFAIAHDGTATGIEDHRTMDLVDTDHRERGIADRLAQSAHSLADGAEQRPIAVGASIAAAVDHNGSVLQPRAFGIPAGSLLRETLEEALGLPVTIDNDANCAALAEHRMGAASGCRFVAVLTLGTNIGLGLILDGGLVRGAHGAAGEVGLLLVPSEPTEHGAARLDTATDVRRFGSSPSLAPRGYAWIEELVGGGALRSAAGGREKVLTAEAYADPLVRPLADRAVEGWAVIIADLMVLLDLEVVVLTGGLAADASHLLDPLRRRVAELVAQAPEIRLGTLGPHAELLGADLIARAALQGQAAGHAGAGPSAQSTGVRK
jgi:glucokinase